MIHDLKCWPQPFDAIASGRKTYEIRKTHDRSYEVGDVLVLHKWDPATRAYVNTLGHPTSGALGSQVLRVTVEYITRGGQWGLPEGVCVMAISMGVEL
jgi:hypothetical protein